MLTRSPLHERVITLQAQLPPTPRGNAVHLVRDPDDATRWMAYYYTDYPNRHWATDETREKAVDTLLRALDDLNGDTP